jgi:hypothetical protein
MELSQKGRFYFDDFNYGAWRFYASQVTKTYPVEIILGRYALSRDLYGKLQESVKQRLKTKSADIDRHFRTLAVIGYARSGRYKLIRKQFGDARKDYVKAMFFRGFNHPVWRLRALVGFVFSLFRMDVESLAALLGKRTYKQ